MEVLRDGRAHARAEPAGHHHCCQIAAHECDGWGARIRTWDRGTKTRCLTTWLRPTGLIVPQPWPVVLLGPRSPNSRTSTIAARMPAAISASEPTTSQMMQRQTASACEAAATQEASRADLGVERPAGEEVERDDRHGDDDHRPGGEVLGERDDDPLGDRDPESELEPACGVSEERLPCRSPALTRATYHASCPIQAQPLGPSGARRPRPQPLVVEQAVDRRAGAADVGAKRAERLELAASGERARSLRRQRGEVAGGERGQKQPRGAPS